MSEVNPTMSADADGIPTEATGVAVTAEWALWGKNTEDSEYRLLACSHGTISKEAFVEQITSFSPGSAEAWPQVTISGFPLHGAGNCVALAIHDTADGRHDAVGREIVYTRYFCVPYQQLAVGRADYRNMYDAFARFWPSMRDRSAQRFMLPHKSAQLPEPQRSLAMRVAALLLTSRAVCVLGADGADASERLAFVDSVMSLLPYGMRSRLTGATWASSTAYDLNLRLFFADARRQGDEHVVSWHEPEAAPIGHPYADQYLRWLTTGISHPEQLLAEATEPMGFDQREVAMMLERFDVSYAKTPSTTALVPPDPAVHVTAVLQECGNRLRGGNPNFLQTELNKLGECVQLPASPQHRAHYRQVIAKEGLLQSHQAVDKRLQDRLYRLLLQLAFETPLTYHSYCEVEACLGEQPHKQLLQAMDPARLTDFRVRLLTLRALGGGELKRMRAELPAIPGPLAAAAADLKVRPEHGRILCELAVPALCACPDRMALCQSLYKHAYLAPALQRLFPTQNQYQYERLCALLHAAHGERLDRRDIPEIFGSPGQMPTVALFAALAVLAEPADVPVIEYEFLAAIIGRTKFDAATQKWLLRALPMPTWYDQDPSLHRPVKSRHGRFRLTLRWLHRNPK